MNDIKCVICDKKIKDEDDVILGSKDDYTKLPMDIKTDNVVFLHSECLKGYLKEKQNEIKK